MIVLCQCFSNCHLSFQSFENVTLLHFFSVALEFSRYQHGGWTCYTHAEKHMIQNMKEGGARVFFLFFFLSLFLYLLELLGIRHYLPTIYLLDLFLSPTGHGWFITQYTQKIHLPLLPQLLEDALILTLPLKKQERTAVSSKYRRSTPAHGLVQQ